MQYHFINSGLHTDVEFPDQDIREIYIPLLEHLDELQKQKTGRILVMLAAPPGAGKSTLASFLVYLAGCLHMQPVTLIGMVIYFIFLFFC